MRRNYFSHVARPQSLVRVDRARAWHPTPRGAKNIPALAAYRREVRRTRSLPVWQNSNVGVRARGFSCWPPDIFDLLRGARAGRKRGPAIFVFLASVLLQAVGQLGHRRPRPVKRRLKDPYSTSRPPFAPQQGSLRLVPQRPARRLPNALARYRQTRLPIRRLLVPKCSLNIHRWLRASASARVVC